MPAVALHCALYMGEKNKKEKLLNPFHGLPRRATPTNGYETSHATR